MAVQMVVIAILIAVIMRTRRPKDDEAGVGWNIVALPRLKSASRSREYQPMVFDAFVGHTHSPNGTWIPMPVASSRRTPRAN
jgi:hypothetical protein